jgi:DNA-binding transcriptional regulator YiaG
MTFPQKLLSERARLGLTQAGAAALLEISKSALEKWEAGIKTPKLLMQEGAIARLAKLKSKPAK